MVYISGQITGKKDYNYNVFLGMERTLEDLGYNVFNPVSASFEMAEKRHCHVFDLLRCDIMANDIMNLLRCNDIIMLSGWEHSKGAILEHNIAREIGIVIHYDLVALKNRVFRTKKIMGEE